MKSPSTSPGIIDAEGMRNGSATNERTKRTIKMTGNSERAWATIHGGDARLSPAPLRRRISRTPASSSKITPVTANAITKNTEKSTFIAMCALCGLVVEVARGDRGNETRAKDEPIPHKDPGAAAFEIVQQAIDRREGGNAREQKPDEKRQPAFGTQSRLEQHPKFEQTGERDRRQAEQKGKARRGLALHAAKEGRRERRSRTRDAGYQSKSLCHANDDAVAHRDLGELAPVPRDFFRQSQQQRQADRRDADHHQSAQRRVAAVQYRPERRADEQQGNRSQHDPEQHAKIRGLIIAGPGGAHGRGCHGADVLPEIDDDR